VGMPGCQSSWNRERLDQVFAHELVQISSDWIVKTSIQKAETLVRPPPVVRGIGAGGDRRIKGSRRQRQRPKGVAFKAGTGEREPTATAHPQATNRQASMWTARYKDDRAAPGAVAHLWR
jgi:hypothetical protein